jgi:coenzyme PQQ precursor peptide PqqA
LYWVKVAGLTSRLSLQLVPNVAIKSGKRSATMAWTTPTLVEICIGLEINGYLPAEI